MSRKEVKFESNLCAYLPMLAFLLAKRICLWYFLLLAYHGPAETVFDQAWPN